MADNGKKAEKDTEASQATQEQQVATRFMSHLQTVSQQKSLWNTEFLNHNETILA